jgi:hypothetical protein
MSHFSVVFNAWITKEKEQIFCQKKDDNHTLVASIKNQILTLITFWSFTATKKDITV